MKIISQIRNAPYALAAALTVVALDEAHATSNTVGGTAKEVLKQVSDVGKLAVAGAFLIGVVMVAAGLMKLKQAADTQGQQVKYGEGLWRLAVGAGLVAVPAVSNMLTGSAGWGAVNINQYNGF